MTGSTSGLMLGFVFQKVRAPVRSAGRQLLFRMACGIDRWTVRRIARKLTRFRRLARRVARGIVRGIAIRIAHRVAH